MDINILPHKGRSLADITQTRKKSLQRTFLSTEDAPHSFRALQPFVQGQKFRTIADDDDIFTFCFSHIHA